MIARAKDGAPANPGAAPTATVADVLRAAALLGGSPESVRRAVTAAAVRILAALSDPPANGSRSIPWAPLRARRPPDPRHQLDSALAGFLSTSPPGSRPLGILHQALLERIGHPAQGYHARRVRGAYFTPPAVVDHLLDSALEPALDAAAQAGGPRAILRLRVCDPACGSGNFLIAAGHRIARRLARARDPRAGSAALRRALGDVATRCLYGVDIDPLAVDVCRACLRLEAGLPAGKRSNIECADALSADWPRLFPGVFPRRFDVVVGNPPFLNQLARPTTAAQGTAAALKRRFPGAVGAYTDAAALFLLLGTELTRRGGCTALVLPQSFLTSRDTAAVRTAVLGRGILEALWVAGERIFDAGVLVCAPTIRIGGPPPRIIQRTHGADFRTLRPNPLDHDALRAAPTWAQVATDGGDVPDPPLRGARTLGDLAHATADFRDQYYGLRGLVVEHDSVPAADIQNYPRLITTGLIDPARCLWGLRPTRFDGRIYNAPRVDLRRLRATTPLGPWARARLHPKLLLATQTRILEAAVDEHGEWLPVVPLITITPRDSSRIWHIAAAIHSPVATAWAIRHYAGAGLSADAIKLSANQTLLLPIPPAGPHGDRAAALTRQASGAPEAEVKGLLDRAAQAMCSAFGLEREESAKLLRWWSTRRVPRTRPKSLSTP